MDYDKKSRILEYVIKAFDGDISPEESQELERDISSSKALAAYYSTCVKTHLCMVELETPQRLIRETGHSEFDPELWQMMAIYENIAPEIEIPKETPPRELLRKVVYPPREKRKMSTFSKVSLIMNAAAVLFIILFLKFAPSQPVEVATLSDSMNARWTDIDSSMQKGTRLVDSSEKLILREGLVELTFDNEAKAVIEAPAEFQILADDRIGLNYGKVYAVVPKKAIGFSVYTPNTKIIDMGTEFGVQAQTRGDTQLYVMKGKTLLMAGSKDNKAGVEVIKGAAKQISGTTQTITDISYDETLFARDFNAANQVIWRQEPSLDLADIAGKGNGLGTGDSTVIIHPIKGYTKDSNYKFITPDEFLPIPENPFINGIFVPNGRPDQVISTRGDVFQEAPETSGLFSIDLVVNPEPTFYGVGGSRHGTIIFNEQLYGEGGRPCIVMHANIGLTFDLDAIRRHYRRGIDQFISRVGIADLKEGHPCNADFYVLVDGQIRYSLTQYKQMGVLNDVSVAINDTDRFLTLTTTDGGDPDYPERGFTERAHSFDWGVFTEPVLVLD